VIEFKDTENLKKALQVVDFAKNNPDWPYQVKPTGHERSFQLSISFTRPNTYAQEVFNFNNENRTTLDKLASEMRIRKIQTA
ncbi:MAG TPA: hypothetical protein PLQ36_02070, partial [Candidatus Gracilibacteria bacterium]|nr:hypothetical protein [Candidatus Gracilibacteria bacterium]